MSFDDLIGQLRLPTARTPRVAWDGVREFFAYHGVWAPGVRALRRLTVKTKILIVLAVMGLPLLPMSVHLVQEQNDTVATTERRLAGAEVAMAAHALLRELNSQRRAASNAGGSDLAPAQALYLKLQAVQSAAAAQGLALEEVWQTVDPVLKQALSAGSADAAVRFQAIARASAGLAQLNRAAVDAGDLRYTRNRILGHHMELAFDDLPQVEFEIDRAWAAQVRLAAEHGGVAVPVEQELGPVYHRLQLLLEQADDEIASLARVTGADAQTGRLQAVAALLPPLLNHLRGAEPMTGLSDYAGLDRAALAETQRLREAHGAAALAQVLASRDDAHAARLWLFGGLSISVLLSLYLFYSFYLVMRGGLQALNGQMNRMARGDLTERPMPLGGDEVAETMSAASASIERLSDLLVSVRLGVGSVTQAAQQVAVGNTDLRARNKRTADALRTMVDGVTRYSEQLQACGRLVETVVGTVQALRLESTRNRRQMARLCERLADLQRKSGEIGEAVQLIDSVAFRTNILALNASVEASKAGAAGRGFAVVALEVRSLALRSAETAKHIHEIVDRSSEDIEQSKLLADDTGRAIESSDGHVDGIHHAMADVSRLTHDGEADSAAILEQVRELREAAHKNLDLVDQLANASTSLRGQGERLAYKVGQFKLG